MSRILVLGAEKQAATSVAGAYPDSSIVFATDRPIVDGWDLANVSMVFAAPGEAPGLAAGADHVVPLCPRWIAGDASLSTTLGTLRRTMPDAILPVEASLPSSGQWIAKGDRWHRPDAPLSGSSEQLEDVGDPNGCGLVFQALQAARSTVMAIGRRHDGGGVQVGIVEVYEERYFHDVILQAGETVAAPDVLDASLAALDALGHVGFFTLNWLRTDAGLKLSSFRPVPRAVFGTFRRGGIDLLAPAAGIALAAPGLRFVADPTYVSYRGLSS